MTMIDELAPVLSPASITTARPHSASLTESVPFAATQDIVLADKVTALRLPSSYPFNVVRIDTIETHFAWLFLTDDLVYKLKKPVCIDRLNNSTLERRRQNCDEELRLNRRLAPHLYLDVVPLTRNVHGELQLEGLGEPVEWLVKMRRLPGAQLLDNAIRSGAIPPIGVNDAAELLARFYLSQPRIDIDPFEYDDALTQAVIANKRALTTPDLHLPRAQIEQLIASQLQCLQRHCTLLSERARYVIDGHGDLRPEHIYVGSPPCIIDCVEFDRELRLMDPAEELSLLQLECEHLDSGWVAEAFFNVYAAITNDRPTAPVRDFYISHRATSRAKLAAWHLRDPTVNNQAHWERKTVAYLIVARTHIERALR